MAPRAPRIGTPLAWPNLSVANGAAAPSGNLRRFSQIGRVLIRHGFGFVFDVRRDRRREERAQEFLAPNFGVRLRQTLDDLGPTFVKFGQLLSTRSDILPEGVLSELQKLQDTVRPMPAGRPRP